MATDILTILPSHVPTNADGVPVLRSNRRVGRRVRYTVEPLSGPTRSTSSSYAAVDERSQASICSESSSSASSSSAGPTMMMSWLLGGVRVRCLAPGCGHECDRSSIDAHTTTCDFVLVGCPHAAMGCPVKGLTRSELVLHLGGCPFQACQSFMASTLRRLRKNKLNCRQQKHAPLECPALSQHAFI